MHAKDIKFLEKSTFLEVQDTWATAIAVLSGGTERVKDR